jgi:drug/metabolite transporter (DMT)-like permease
MAVRLDIDLRDLPWYAWLGVLIEFIGIMLLMFSGGVSHAVLGSAESGRAVMVAGGVLFAIGFAIGWCGYKAAKRAHSKR